MSAAVDLMCVGDLILSASNASFYFDRVRPILAGADVAVAQVEWPHTDRGQVCTVDIPAPAVPPGNLDAVAECGFSVATLASNHMFDQGPFGVIDTIEHLQRRQIQTAGAGATLADARQPVVVERGGLRIGLLSYNAVGPRESWATEVKAGVAYVRVLAHYELDIASPGSPPAEYTSLDGDSVIAMQADIEQLAARTDCVVVCIHKGMGFVHAQLAEYERPLARCAIDAGADVVIGHHAHILRGVEVYKGRPIFHGINHFVTAYTEETDPLSHRARRPRPRRAPSLDFFSPDRTVEHFPFPRDSRHTMIARVLIDERGVRQAGFVPCYINEHAQPVPVDADDDATTEYVAQITVDAGLEAPTLTRQDGWVTFLDQAA